MALYKIVSVNKTTKVLIWKIEESISELKKGISLSKNSSTRLQSMKSELHQKGFLSIRHLLKKTGYTDFDLNYDSFGKPHLNDSRYISITHSFIFTGIILSENLPVGIDIEKQRDKILKIAHKFSPIEAYKQTRNSEMFIRKLTVVWGAKESLYKIYGKKRLSFLNDIYINDFVLEDQQTTGEIRFNGEEKEYQVAFSEFEGFTCVCAF